MTISTGQRDFAGWRLYGIAALGAAILCCFAVFNGYAVFFNDSRSYVRGGGVVAAKIFGHRIDDQQWKSRPAITAGAVGAGDAGAAAAGDAATSPDTAPSKAVTGNRSVYYGILAFLGYRLSNFWLTIVVQALAVSLVAAIALLRGAAIGRLPYFLSLLAIAVVTDAGVFVAYIMPDVFAAVTILIAAVAVAYWDRLLRRDKAVLFVIGAYAVCTHPSHLVILGLIIAAVLVAAAVTRTRVRRGALLTLAGCEVVGIVATLAFNVVATRLTGERPLLLPHITAHLVEMGPGMKYIRAKCPAAGFAVCEFAPRLPVGWVEFLSSTDPRRGVFGVADPATQRRLSDEQTSFARAVILFDPVGVLVGTVRDVVRQTVLFDLDTLKLSPKARANFQTSFPAPVFHDIAVSRVGQSDATLTTISRINLGVVLLTSAGLLYFAFRRRDGRAGEPRSASGVFAVMIVVGVAANAIVCGSLASPEPRFQSRVVWLIPLAFAALAGARRAVPDRRAVPA